MFVCVCVCVCVWKEFKKKALKIATTINSSCRLKCWAEHGKIGSLKEKGGEKHTHTHTHTHRFTNSQTERRIHRWTNRRTNRQANKQTNGQIDRKGEKAIKRENNEDRKGNRKHKNIDRQTDRQTPRERIAHTHTPTNPYTDNLKLTPITDRPWTIFAFGWACGMQPASTTRWSRFRHSFIALLKLSSAKSKGV